MLELRIRACHVTGEFAAKDNRKRLALRPQQARRRRRASTTAGSRIRRVTFAQEKLKVEERLPAARAFIREHKLNEVIAGDLDDIGIIVMGGLTNSVLRALERLGLADVFGASRVPILVLNVVYPLVPEEIREFCAGKRAVLVVEEGNPDYIEQAINVELRRADIQTARARQGTFCRRPANTPQTCCSTGSRLFWPMHGRQASMPKRSQRQCSRALLAHKAKAAAALGPLPPRPPTFCTGCPERPVFSAIKLMQREIGPTHISADIGCHSFATFAPFCMGNSILGYGMSLASAAAVSAKSGDAADRGHGRRRLLAQRRHHRRRLQPVQQRRRRADRHAERLHLGDRPAIHAVDRSTSRDRRGRPAWTSSRRCAPWA